MGHKGIHRRSTGVLPVLQALVDQNRRFDLNSLDDTAFQTALNGGAGSILAYVTAEGDNVTRSTRSSEVQSADLTMRMITAEMLGCLEQILEAARREGVKVTLLKGCAAALRYYPEPHLRTMGDVDLLVSDAQHERLERRLRELGFEQPGDPQEILTRHHHHTLPFRHPSNGFWFEIHTRPYPSHSPLHNLAGFSSETLSMRSESIAVGSQSVTVLNHEQQLVYTATRWAEMINAERGAFPLLDAALLLRSCDGRLDWNEIYRLADEPWAAGALVLMLTYLDRWHLAQVPRAVLSHLGNRDAVTNAVVRRLLHRLVTDYVIEGRRPGPVMTASNRRIVWSTLAAAKSPWVKLLELPFNVMFPPAEHGRFDGARVIRRFRTVVRAMRRQ
jgi:putative nucleotidyltransferase-like protein